VKVLGVLGVAELAAPSGEAAASEHIHSVGIGQPKPPEQLAPAVRPVGGKGFGFHLNVAAILQQRERFWSCAPSARGRRI